MLKKHGLRYCVKYCSIVYFLLFAAVLVVINPVIIGLFCTATHVTTDSIFYTCYKIAIPILLTCTWGYLFFSHLRERRYHYLTGRNYYKDQQYHRSYSELIEYFKDADPYRIDANTLPSVSWKNAEGMILGTKKGHLFHIQSGKDGQNILLLGRPGSGKTAACIIPSCLRVGMHHPLSKTEHHTDASVFCIDLKNDIWKATHEYRNIKRFNLMNTDDSCHYNPFHGIEHLSIDERCNFIENIGFNIVPTLTEGNSRYFSETAQDFWNGIALYLLHQDIHTSFPSVIKAILAGNPVGWIKKIVASDCAEAKRRLQSKWGENEKNLSGGYSNLAQCCRKFASNKLFFLLDNNPDYEYISVQTLEDGYDCYLTIDQAELANYSALLSLIVQGFLTGFLHREANPNSARLPDGTLRPIWMLLDECAQLKTLSLDIFSSSLMTLRSRNINICMAIQSLSSLSEMWNEKAAKSLIDTISTFVILSIQEISTREWASKLIGDRKVLRISNSINDASNGRQNSGKSVQEATEPIFPPEQWGNLIDKEMGRDELVVYTQGKYIKLDKQYYFK